MKRFNFLSCIAYIVCFAAGYVSNQHAVKIQHNCAETISVLTATVDAADSVIVKYIDVDGSDEMSDYLTLKAKCDSLTVNNK
jgi:hypothetical protein